MATGPNTSVAVTEQKPDFLAKESTALGTENVNAYLRPARLKIIQPTAGEPFVSMFGAGDVIVVPTMQLLAPLGKPFRLTPIYFFPQWCLWNPIQLKGQVPAIAEQSLDPMSPLAIASRNPATRSRPCNGNPTLNCDIAEHLNIVFVVQDDENFTMPIVASFFRGEHGTGSTWLQLMKLRQSSIFGCIFEAESAVRNNTKGRWYGLNISNPATSAWVKDEAQYESFKKLHLEYKKAHDNRQIDVSFDDIDVNAG